MQPARCRSVSSACNASACTNSQDGYGASSSRSWEPQAPQRALAARADERARPGPRGFDPRDESDWSNVPYQRYRGGFGDALYRAVTAVARPVWRTVLANIPALEDRPRWRTGAPRTPEEEAREWARWEQEAEKASGPSCTGLCPARCSSSRLGSDDDPARLVYLLYFNASLRSAWPQEERQSRSARAGLGPDPWAGRAAFLEADRRIEDARAAKEDYLRAKASGVPAAERHTALGSVSKFQLHRNPRCRGECLCISASMQTLSHPDYFNSFIIPVLWLSPHSSRLYLRADGGAEGARGKAGAGDGGPRVSVHQRQRGGAREGIQPAEGGEGSAGARQGWGVGGGPTAATDAGRCWHGRP